MGKSRQKRPYVDRKNSVTFHLVHRSQHDPLITDQTAPQHILLESVRHEKRVKEPVEFQASNKRYEEQQKYGIHFDDDYNYLQHLKHRWQEEELDYVEEKPMPLYKGTKDERMTIRPKLHLPSSVFASEFEENEGVLNKAALQIGPRPDWDADIIAALEDDFNFSDVKNQLEDDFVLKAMIINRNEIENDTKEYNEEHDIDSNNLHLTIEDNEELINSLNPLMRKNCFVTEETKSRFTEYSISSAVIHRNKQLALLDDRFEHFYSTYNDPELGDLATEEIEGTWHQKHPYILGCFKEYKKKKFLGYSKEWNNDFLKRYLYTVDSQECSDEELVVKEVEDNHKEKIDCESIISTYQHIHNHPKLILEPTKKTRSSLPPKIQIDPKSNLPKNVLRNYSKQLTLDALSELNDATCNYPQKSLGTKSVLSTITVLSLRPKDETAEEKRERKRLLKEYRNERRIEKKINRQAFQSEKERLIQMKVNRHT